MSKDLNKDNCINNLRPITLMSAEFKILAKALASKLMFVVDDLVGVAQTRTIS